MYRFLKTDITIKHEDLKWEIGKWYKHSAGFHASVWPVDALRNAPGEVIAEVEVRGESVVRADKLAWPEIRVLRAWNWTKEDSVKLAVYAAELVIDFCEQQGPTSDRLRRTIEAVKVSLRDDYPGSTIHTALATADAIETVSTCYPITYAVYACVSAANAAASTTAVNAAKNAARAIRAATSATELAAVTATTVTNAADVLDKCNGWMLARIAELAEIEGCVVEEGKNA